MVLLSVHDIASFGISNAVNFTDGLDGLLAGTSAIAFGAFTVIALMATEPETAIFSAAMIGAVLGFLVFNAHPAKVFMGDTGSLGIGGATGCGRHFDQNGNFVGYYWRRFCDRNAVGHHSSYFFQNDGQARV